MKKIYLLFFSLLVFSMAEAKDDCETIYSTASYALNHAKSALKANNYDHQKYYSGKALESYEKLFKLLEGSQCEGLSEKVQDIIADALKAADPADWDRGRYYSKKVFNSTQDLISYMDSRTEVAGVEITP
ncbi:hypothetical protein [Arenibacter sp. F20364]|uniref:hypothetical protein n=1 Tax=Arenibacter sp. F20364 TaxID=2926415 RepID=UPI001FF4F3EB|nr:hypothetical protein [Arenibacter sp. F20364]MCK0191123.1 hypothetical protein [Arenibacter sp. F20364]